MVAFALVVVLFLVSGCGQMLFHKPGMTPQSFNADKFDCEQKVVTMYGGYAQMGAGHAIMARGDMKNCFLAKGYAEVEQ